MWGVPKVNRLTNFENVASGVGGRKQLVVTSEEQLRLGSDDMAIHGLSN